jgi:hypothetical protein
MKECPECQSTHIRRKGKRRGKKITFVSIVGVNLSKIPKGIGATTMNSAKNASKCISIKALVAPGQTHAQ